MAKSPTAGPIALIHSSRCRWWTGPAYFFARHLPRDDCQPGRGVVQRKHRAQQKGRRQQQCGGFGLQARQRGETGGENGGRQGGNIKSRRASTMSAMAPAARVTRNIGKLIAAAQAVTNARVGESSSDDDPARSGPYMAGMLTSARGRPAMEANCGEPNAEAIGRRGGGASSARSVPSGSGGAAAGCAQPQNIWSC